MKKIVLASILLSFVFSMAVANIATAQLPSTEFPEQAPPEPIKSKSDALKFINLILTWIFTIFVALAIIFLILAGIQFLTAGGDATKLSAARDRLIWAVVGIVVALIARGLPAVLSNVLGV